MFMVNYLYVKNNLIKMLEDIVKKLAKPIVLGVALSFAAPALADNPQKLLKNKQLEEYVLSEKHKEPEFRKAFAIVTYNYLDNFYKNKELLKATIGFMKATELLVVKPARFWEELLYNPQEWLGAIAEGTLTGEGPQKKFLEKIGKKISEHTKKRKINHPEIETRENANDFLRAGIEAGERSISTWTNKDCGKAKFYPHLTPELEELARQMLADWFNFGDYTVLAKETFNDLTRQNFSKHEMTVLDHRFAVDEKKGELSYNGYTFSAATKSFFKDEDKEAYDMITLEALAGIQAYEPYRKFYAMLQSKKAVNQLTIKRLEIAAGEFLEQARFECRSYRLWSTVKYDMWLVGGELNDASVEKLQRKCPIQGIYTVDEYGKVRCSKHSDKEGASITTAPRLAQNDRFFLDDDIKAVEIFIEGCKNLHENSSSFHMVRFPTAGKARAKINKYDPRFERTRFREDFSKFHDDFQSYEIGRVEHRTVGVKCRDRNYVFHTRMVDGDIMIEEFKECSTVELQRFDFSSPKKANDLFIEGAKSDDMLRIIESLCDGEFRKNYQLIPQGMRKIGDFFRSHNTYFIGETRDGDEYLFMYEGPWNNPFSGDIESIRNSVVVRKTGNEFRVFSIRP